MNDQNDNTKKGTLTVSTPAKLQLTKTVEGGTVRQNFTHGRSKTVTVEVRKTRTFARDAGGLVEVRQGAAAQGAAIAQPSQKMPTRNRNADDANLTSDEREARLRALKYAEETTRATPRTPARPSTTAPEAPEEVEEILPVQEEPPAEEPETSDSNAVPANSMESRKPTGLRQLGNSQARTAPAGVVTPIKRPTVVTSPALEQAQKPAQRGVERTVSDVGEDAERVESKPGKLKLRRGDEERRNSGKITVSRAMDYLNEDSIRMRSLASLRRQREKAKRGEIHSGPAEKVLREVVIPETITVQELANRMAERATDVIKQLMKLGMMVTVNQAIDADTAELVVSEFGHSFKRVTEGDVENVLKQDQDEDPAFIVARAPVVTIMGHVDHGKTSLLDALRKTDVVAGEAGGITQHIGAYRVALESSQGTKQQHITFLDTPGHEAFTAMRARGAKVTDIVVLVVAADDGIMEQTKEAISHAKAAGVPIIVAVNKVDKPDADPARVRNELMSYELVAEEFGGDIMVVDVSAKQKIGLDKLKETILLQAEVLELKANPDRAAAGVVIEAKMAQGRGPVATLLVQKGTLRVGDILVAGGTYGKIRALVDDKGRMLKEAGPSMPVEVQGLEDVPVAGDEFAVVENEKTARDIAEYRIQRQKKAQAVVSARTMDQMFTKTGEGLKQLNLIVKGDVHGSVEAIAGSLAKLATPEVAVRAIHSGVGAITESDVVLAQTTGASVIGFNVRAVPKAKALADKEKISIRYYAIIYELVDDVKAALGGMLSPTQREKILGYAEIRQVFNITKAGKVAGCMVTEGLIKRGARVRLLRDNVVIHEGSLKTLKRFKDEVREVKSGFECGMAFENYEDIREGDRIEGYEIEEVARVL